MKKLILIILSACGIATAGETNDVQELEPTVVATGFEFSGFVQTTLWDKYLLFQVPVIVSHDPNLQSLLVLNLPHGFGFGLWNAEDLSSSSFGDEVDWDVWWSGNAFDFDVTVGVGMWDVHPTFETPDDILTGYVQFGKSFTFFDHDMSWYVKPRYYHTRDSFLARGWNISSGLNTSLQLAEKWSLDLNPFVSYDDGFGVKPGFYVGGNATLNYHLNDRTKIFATGRGVSGKNLSESGGGVGVSISF